jgi:hypothetical protein
MKGDRMIVPARHQQGLCPGYDKKQNQSVVPGDGRMIGIRLSAFPNGVGGSRHEDSKHHGLSASLIGDPFLLGRPRFPMEAALGKHRSGEWATPNNMKPVHQSLDSKLTASIECHTSPTPFGFSCIDHSY